jgi:hypothetical protein
MLRKPYTAILFGLTTIAIIFLLRPFVSTSYAEKVGEKIEVPITFTSSDPVTAADFRISIKGGRLISLECGGVDFQQLLVSQNNNCVVFNTEGGSTDGVLATVVVQANKRGTLEVTTAGNLSTAEGKEPKTSTVTGATYEIDGIPGIDSPLLVILLLVLLIVIFAGSAALYWWRSKEERKMPEQEDPQAVDTSSIDEK